MDLEIHELHLDDFESDLNVVWWHPVSVRPFSIMNITHLCSCISPEQGSLVIAAGHINLCKEIFVGMYGLQYTLTNTFTNYTLLNEGTLGDNKSEITMVSS